MGLAWESVARTPAGEDIRAVTLDNSQGLRARVMAYGATLLELWAPDRNGQPVDVTLGFDHPQSYLSIHPYFGAVVGRYANRIAGARFSLEGREHVLAANDGPHHLHGGRRGFDKVLWQVENETLGSQAGVAWRYSSPAGEEGYPGKLDVQVAYRLTDDNALRLDYEARADAATPVNLTHHAYWNLAGGGDILDHRLVMSASHFLPVDAGLIPTGERRPVAGTPMDFLVPIPIRARLQGDDPQLKLANGGYDHTWILGPGGNSPTLAARLEAPSSGIGMEVWTTEPGLQFYSGNFLDGSLIGKGGRPYRKHAGLCLEAHHFPDSPHHPDFPNTILTPGETYRQTTIYRFSVLTHA